MVEIRVLQDIEQGSAAAGFGAGRPDDDAVDSGLDNGSGAHLTGLQSAVERASLQTPVTNFLAGLADAGNLCVRQCRLVRVPPIVSPRDDFSFIDDDSADRDLSERNRLFRLLQGGFHVFDIVFIFCIHGILQAFFIFYSLISLLFFDKPHIQICLCLGNTVDPAQIGVLPEGEIIGGFGDIAVVGIPDGGPF